MADLTGQTIGNYRVESLLGTGGMGQVYRATHIHLNRPAAIKFLHEQYAADPTFQARFQQEAQAASSLRHPNIVEIIDFGMADGRYYLVMELITEGSVRTLLQQRAGAGTPLALPLGVDLVRQAAEGLNYAHTQSMIHRDIKPDNLLISRGANGPVGPSGYNVKITDFGLARLAEGGVATAHGATMGTPAYMSPEQCQAIDLDGRSDIYSLGVVLYEVTTGYLPFETKSLSDAVYKHVYTEPPPPRQVKADLPEALEQIILRCLKKAPAERYQTAQELADALKALYPSLGGMAEENEQRVTQIGTPEGIQVLLDRQSYAVSAGVPAQLRITLANLGQVPAPVDLSVEGVPAEWLTLPPLPVQVAGGSPQTVVVQVLVPKEAGIAAGARPLTITATSRTNPPHTASGSAQLDVQAFSLNEATLEPARISGRGGGTATLRLKNGGNAPVVWNVQAAAGSPEMAVELAAATTTVNHGASAAIPVRVKVPKRWKGGKQTLGFTVQAAPAGSQAFNLPGELVQGVVAPIWGIALVAVALIALIGGGVALAARGGGTNPDATATVPLVLITATAAPQPTITPTTPPPATPTVAEPTTEPFTPTVPAVVDTPTVPVIVEFTPTVVVPPAAGQILYSANIGAAPGAAEVVTIGSDGQNVQRLTDNEFDDWQAQWSPDGERIAFTHDVTLEDNSHSANTWLMNADGSSKQQVTDLPGLNEWPLWSPDGTKLVYSHRQNLNDGQGQIYVLDLVTRENVNISANAAGNYTANWSPDGSKVAYATGLTGNNDIYIANADGSGDPQRLTNSDAGESLPVWSPDGSKICFVRDVGDTNSLIVVNADGTGEITIATNVADQPDTTWSPEGARIAYVGLGAGNPDIYVVNPDGSDSSRVQLTVDPKDDVAPAWSPDGALIAFISTRDGLTEADGKPIRELYLMNADGSGQAPLTTEPVQHDYPDWRPAQ